MFRPFTDPDTGKVFTFEHLQTFNETISVSVDKQRHLVPLAVVFSSHCFTDGKTGTVSMKDPLYYTTDSTGHRAFCHMRYGSSLVLPQRIREVIRNSGNCHKLTTPGNYAHIHDPRLPDRFAGWYVLFNFSNPKRNEPDDVKVSVTSYHYRQSKPDNLKWLTPSKFPVHLANWLRDRPALLQRYPLE